MMSLDRLRLEDITLLDSVRLEVRRGLQLHLPFIENSGATIKDFSGNGNDGTIKGWLSGWDQRIKLTIDNGDIDDTLTNFPVLVHLSTSSGITGVDVSAVFDEVGANSLKIAVTSADGETELYVEVEEWDNGSEEAWLWVKIPTISSTSGTILYLYYDNDHADNTTYVGAPNSAVAENVWDSNFKLVCHMQDDPDTSNVKDSTTNDNDGIKKGAGEPAEANGKIGKCQTFDGTDDFVKILDAATLNLSGSDMTLEIWIKTSNTGALDCILDKSNLSSGNNGYTIIKTVANKSQLEYYDGSAPSPTLAGTTTITDGLWHYVVIQWKVDNSTRQLSVDLNIDDAVTSQSNDGADSIYDLYFGGRAGTNGTDFNYTGSLDEVRITKGVMRTDEWIKASYETQRDHLITFGSEVTLITYQNNMRVLGKIGLGLDLDGVLQYVECPDIDLDYVSICAWVKADAGTRGYIVSKTYASSVIPFSLNIGGNDASANLDGIGFYSGGWKNSGITTDIRGDGQWHFIVGTYDGTTLKYYVDGVLDSSSTEGSGVLPKNNATVDVGRYLQDNDFFGGQIDEVRIYNVALTTTEIKQLYKMGRR